MKASVLKALRAGSPVSGGEMGRLLGVSRTAIWKYVRELRREGYHIDASPGKGYSLLWAPDSLLPDELREGLRTHFLGHEIVYHHEVGSTQDVAKSLAIQGSNEGTIVIAERQARGKGRVGRTWASLPGSIALSIILRPVAQPSEATRFPLMAGVAVAHAIEKITNLNPKLKWPNDIIIGGKKAGGILTEMSGEMDRITFIIIGIGINVTTGEDAFPEELKGTATSLQAEGEEKASRILLVQNILAELESLYTDFMASGFNPILEKWKSISNTIGMPVSISSKRQTIEGRAIDIDQDGALVLQKEDGELERIVAGDVSLRNV